MQRDFCLDKIPVFICNICLESFSTTQEFMVIFFFEIETRFSLKLVQRTQYTCTHTLIQIKADRWFYIDLMLRVYLNKINKLNTEIQNLPDSMYDVNLGNAKRKFSDSFFFNFWRTKYFFLFFIFFLFFVSITCFFLVVILQCDFQLL